MLANGIKLAAPLLMQPTILLFPSTTSAT